MSVPSDKKLRRDQKVEGFISRSFAKFVDEDYGRRRVATAIAEGGELQVELDTPSSIKSIKDIFKTMGESLLAPGPGEITPDRIRANADFQRFASQMAEDGYDVDVQSVESTHLTMMRYSKFYEQATVKITPRV